MPTAPLLLNISTTPSSNSLLSKLEIPLLDYASQGNAILGIRDSGKTHTAMKAAECLLDAGIPIIAFDPIGVWKYLKVGKGGNKGYPVVVAGGEGADIRLTAKNVKDVVRAAMKENISLVIDLYSRELGNKSTWRQIVLDAVEVLMYENESIRHIFIEEAAEFIPQRVLPQQGQVYASIERLARMGRNVKLGYTIINQRAEEVNKAILEICAYTFLHKQVGRNSIVAIKKWLGAKGLDVDDYYGNKSTKTDKKHVKVNPAEMVAYNLDSLKQGECWVIGLEGLPILTQIAERKTFHPDPKKDAKLSNVTLPAKSTIDVSSFVERMKKALEETHSEQDNALPSRNKGATHINVSRGTVEASKSLHASKVVTDNKTQELLSKQSEEIRSLKEQIKVTEKESKHWEANFRLLHKQVLRVRESYKKLLDNFDEVLHVTPEEIQESNQKNRQSVDVTRISKTSTANGAAREIQGSDISFAGNMNTTPTTLITGAGGATRILKAAAMFYPEEITKSRIGILARLSTKSGSFGTYISTLRREGLIEGNGATFKATSKGIKEAGEIPVLPDNPVELIEMWCGVIGNNSGSARIFRLLAEQYPKQLTKEEIGHQAGLSHKSGSFGTYISTLKRNGLITGGNGNFKAADELFDNYKL